MSRTVGFIAKACGVCVIALLAATSVNGQSADGLSTLSEATRDQSWPFSPPPAGTVAIPVVASKTLSSTPDRLLVCSYEGAQPQSYPVLSRTCRDSADYCTVFVAIPATDHIRLLEYDAGNPPVAVASDEPCAQPAHPPTGVLSRTMPRG